MASNSNRRYGSSGSPSREDRGRAYGQGRSDGGGTPRNGSQKGPLRSSVSSSSRTTRSYYNPKPPQSPQPLNRQGSPRAASDPPRPRVSSPSRAGASRTEAPQASSRQRPSAGSSSARGGTKPGTRRNSELLGNALAGGDAPSRIPIDRPSRVRAGGRVTSSSADDRVRNTTLSLPYSGSGKSHATSRQRTRVNEAPTVADLRARERKRRLDSIYRRYIVKLVVAVIVVVALVFAGIFVYRSNFLQVTTVTVSGASYLDAGQITALAAIPSDTTLLRIDTDAIASRLKTSAWVSSVSIVRHVPDTIELSITERKVAAVVIVPGVGASGTDEPWAVSSDGVWLGPVKGYKQKTASTTVSSSDALAQEEYALANNASAIDVSMVSECIEVDDVVYGTSPVIGQSVTDSGVLNALSLASGLSDTLLSQVLTISAASAEKTSLVLTDGVEVAFGSATDISTKEQIILDLLAEHEGKISYINVRVVDRPTWRALS
jgi:cell division protein FtsQ